MLIPILLLLILGLYLDSLGLITASLSLLVVAFSLILMHYMRKGRERLRMVESLRSSLLGHVDERTPLPSTDYAQIARIERAQILYDRQQSIRTRSKKAEKSIYVVQMSRAVIKARAELDDETKMRVEEEIDELASKPRVGGLKEDAEAGIVHLRVPGTSAEIGYSVDDKARRIKVHSLRPLTDSGA